MWAAIKKAINSTVGTANFKPLDKVIDSKITLQPSNNIYRLLRYHEKGASFPTGGYIASAKFNCQGCVKIFANVTKGGVLIQLVKQNGTSRDAVIEAGDDIINRLCNVEPGDEVRITSMGISVVTQVYIGAVESNLSILDSSSIISDDMEAEG
jgi:hypothetical protein